MHTKKIEVDILDTIDEIESILEEEAEALARQVVGDSLTFENEETDDEIELKNEIVPYEGLGSSGSESCLAIADGKRREIDSIQEDLQTLVTDLNNFVETQVTPRSICLSDDDSTEEEKQDGPSEKEQLSLYKDNSFYVCDGTNPAEINWNILAPYIQNTVGDLQTISNLNTMLSSMIGRLKRITQKSIGDVDGKI